MYTCTLLVSTPLYLFNFDYDCHLKPYTMSQFICHQRNEVTDPYTHTAITERHDKALNTQTHRNKQCIYTF